ncbi:MYCBP-associated protein isoform X2 [Hyla sarda]|uniref:MYCBP-associated protein isoform X2 n=1 Tax=Hyla sarda TaxID=327740 RepID=UPI0024C2DDA3|nr:MYCBP-associated protein isoform X2 [Hyla sarda]
MEIPSGCALASRQKKLKPFEQSTSPVPEQTEPAISTVLKGDEIQALAIKLEDLEKLHPPRQPKEEPKSSVRKQILIRKHQDQEQSRKKRLLVARPVPSGSASQGQAFSGVEVPLCDTRGRLLPHNILGTLQELSREATARGDLQVAELIPDEPLFDILGTYEEEGELQQKKEAFTPLQKQDNALNNWQYHMNLRKRQLDALSRQLCKPKEQLLMSVCEDFRKVREERHLIDRCIPALEHGKGQRIGSEFWNTSELIGDELTGLTLTLTQFERGYPSPVTHIGKPCSIQQETGSAERPPFHCTWDKSLYLQHRKEKLKAVMEELNFTQPDIAGLEVIGRGRPFTSVSAEHVSLSDELQETPSEDKENQNPLSDFPDVVPDYVSGPSLLFCGQPAVWIENPLSYREKVGISTRITFEALAGEKASSVLEVVNNGSAAVWYEWRRLPHATSLGDRHKEPRGQHFYFNTSAGAILPGETQTFPFYFKSPTAGIFSESWEFCTHPVLLAGALIQVSLWGISLYEDKTAPMREALQRELESREALFIAQKMVEDILVGVRSPERPLSPVTQLTEEEMFCIVNPKLHYKHETVQELHQLWKEYISPNIHDSISLAQGVLDHFGQTANIVESDELEDGEKLEHTWNLSIVEMKKAAMAIPDDEARETFLLQLNKNITELTEPVQEAPLDLLHLACLQLWRDAIDELVEQSMELRYVLGMPDKDMTVELTIDDPALDQKRVKGGKEEKRGGGVKEDKRTPGGKEKDEKKAGKTTKDKSEKEERPNSRKLKGKDDKKLSKPSTISRENKELMSSGESLDFTPPESRLCQVDPIIQEKYKENLCTVMNGILETLVDKMGLIAEDLKLGKSVSKAGNQNTAESYEFIYSP